MYPRDHWRSLLRAEARDVFQELIETTVVNEHGEWIVEDLMAASAALGRRRNYCGRMFVMRNPFLVCVNRERGAGWRMPYCLFERLTEAYFFREGPRENQTALMLPVSYSSEREMALAPADHQETQAVVRPAALGFLELIGGYTLKSGHAEFEAWYMRRVLQICNGNMNLASRLMGISRASFYRKLGGHQRGGLISPDV